MNTQRLKKYLSPWNMLYFALGLLLLIFLLRKTDFASLAQLLRQIKPGYFLLGGGLYLLKATLRSARFLRIHQRSKRDFFAMLRLSLATSLASQILPLKLGELSYIYLLKKDRRASISQGVSSLIVIRVVDLLAIAFLFLAFSAWVRFPANFAIYFRSILVAVGLLLALLVALLVFAKRSGPILRWFAQWRVVNKVLLLQKLLHAAEETLRELSLYTPRQYGEWSILAGLEWLVNFATFHVLLLGIGMTPHVLDTVVSVTFAAFASVLPVNSFGSFGTQEAGWATGLLLLGYSQQIALASGFATHLLTLAYMLVFGGLAWLSYGVGPTSRSAALAADESTHQ